MKKKLLIRTIKDLRKEFDIRLTLLKNAEKNFDSVKESLNMFENELASKEKKSRCERCGQKKGSTDYVENPYEQDVHGLIKMEYLCDECYEDLAIGI